MGPAASLPSPGLLESLAPLRPAPLCPELRAHQAGDVFALWRAWEQESGAEQGVPFWTIVWPAAAALARLILDSGLDVAGKRLLEVGCGSAVAAIAASRAGAAAVTANDISPAALFVARANAEANNALLRFSPDNLIASAAPVDTDIALLADLFYERPVAEQTLAWLRRVRRPGMQVIVADAGRPFAPRERLTVLHEVDVPVNADLEGVAARHVIIGQLDLA